LSPAAGARQTPGAALPRLGGRPPEPVFIPHRAVSTFAEQIEHALGEPGLAAVRTQTLADIDRESPPLFGADGRGRVARGGAAASGERVHPRAAGEATAAAALGTRICQNLADKFDGPAPPRRAHSSTSMRGPSNKALAQLADRGQRRLRAFRAPTKAGAAVPTAVGAASASLLRARHEQTLAGTISASLLRARAGDTTTGAVPWKSWPGKRSQRRRRGAGAGAGLWIGLAPTLWG
jgi:hypothetical protein